MLRAGFIFFMTLHEYLKKHGIRLDKSQEGKVGTVVAEKYLAEFGTRAVKMKGENWPCYVNDYPEAFLDSVNQSITDKILQLHG